MNKYIIIPGCSDLNRGDQALVWETKRLAEDCGYVGEFYLTSEKNEPNYQSEKFGLKIITPILEHPSRRFKSKENISYCKRLKIKWGLVSLIDLIGSFFYFFSPSRKIKRFFLSEEKRYSLEMFEKADAIFVKGGGLLQTHGGIISTYSMYFWVFHILLAHKLNKPVYVMPNSLGPFEGPFVKKIAKSALQKCRLLSSRETISQNMVKEQLKIESENYPDLAFFLKESELDKDAIFNRFNLPRDRKLVAITMRPYRFPHSQTPTKDYHYFKNEMSKFIHMLYERGCMPVIVEHTLAVNAHENDGACIKDVTKKVAEHEYRIVADDSFNCKDLKRIYSFCDYIVGTRFHSVIFSLGCGVPGLAIAYVGNKSQGIMHDIGLDDYVIKIENVSARKLEELFDTLLSDEKNVKEKIEEYISKASDKRGKLIEYVRRSRE